MTLRKIFVRLPVVSIAFLVLVPLIAHLLFSPLGFNPTDDGFTLAYSRRIIEGQIPHRDFIIIRPILSPLLHVPFVLWGGAYTFTLSRLFVWFQMACMAWVGVIVIEKMLRISLGNLAKISLALISLAVSANIFPTMAWHTIDGLFLYSIGLALCLKENQNGKLTGYFLMGMAYLCKQNFIFLAPLSLLILGDWRKIKVWLSILLPGILYGIFLLLTGAFNDALLQLTSQNNLLFYGFQIYNQPKLLFLVFTGFFSTFFIIGTPRSKGLPTGPILEWIGLLALSAAPLAIVVLTFISGSYILSLSFWIFSLVVGVVICLLIKKEQETGGLIRVALIFLLMAWSSSISIGSPYPDLVSGQLMAFLLAFTLPILKRKLEIRGTRKLLNSALIAVTCVVLLSLGISRTHHIFRDLPAEKLTKTLDSVLPGGKGIRTNPNTYSFLAGLAEAIKITRSYGTTYSIIPDCAACWVEAPQANPLPIDWVQKIELNKPELISRVIQALESMRNSNVVILQKVDAKELEHGFVPFSDEFEVMKYVRDRFTKVYETPLFEIYK